MRAHAPGSVTTVFAPTEDGANGISLATEDGVVADVTPADETVVTMDGEPTDFEPVELACEALGIDASIDLTAEIPVGRGFGASGAATLATVLAADAEFGLGRDREALLEVAARAEIEAGTGLSDVYVQDLGGFVWNLGDGRRNAPSTEPLCYASYGAVDTASVLGDPATMDRIREAAGDVFEAFDPDAGLAPLFEDAWTFAGETGLVTDRVAADVERVREAGGAATMAMVGETVIATGAGGVLPEQTRITPEGAHLLE